MEQASGFGVFHGREEVDQITSLGELTAVNLASLLSNPRQCSHRVNMWTEEETGNGRHIYDTNKLCLLHKCVEIKKAHWHAGTGCKWHVCLFVCAT